MTRYGQKQSMEETYLDPVYYSYDDLANPFPPVAPQYETVELSQETKDEVTVDQEETDQEGEDQEGEEQEDEGQDEAGEPKYVENDSVARVHADLDRLVLKHFSPRCVIDRTSGRVSCPPRAIKSHAVPTRSTVLRASRGHGSSLMGWKRPSMVASRPVFP
jgi:hypothetical protein